MQNYRQKRVQQSIKKELNEFSNIVYLICSGQPLPE